MKAIWFVVFLIVLQQIEGNLIYPHVVGKSVGLPGIWVFFAVIVGSGLGRRRRYAAGRPRLRRDL